MAYQGSGSDVPTCISVHQNMMIDWKELPLVVARLVSNSKKFGQSVASII